MMLQSTITDNEWVVPLLISTIIGIVLAIVGWSFKRNEKGYDAGIEENKQAIKDQSLKNEAENKELQKLINKLQVDYDVLQLKMHEDKLFTQRQIFDMTDKIRNDIATLSIKIAEINGHVNPKQ